MKDLRITVNNKIATYQKRDGDIVCGNNDYRIVFTFDKEWDNHATKTARFIWNNTYTDVVFDGNICPVPIITNATSCEVGVYAGNLATTTPAEIGCIKSILCSGGMPASPSEDVYSQIMQRLNQLDPMVGAKIIPVVVIDMDNRLESGIESIGLRSVFGYSGNGVISLESEFARVTEQHPYLLCYTLDKKDDTSDSFYTDLVITPQQRCSLDVSFYFADGTYKTESLFDVDEWYYPLTRNIEYIVVFYR